MPKSPLTRKSGGQRWLSKTSVMLSHHARSREDGPAAIEVMTVRGARVFQCLWFTGDCETPTRTNGPWLIRSDGTFSTVDHLKQMGLAMEKEAYA